MAPPASDRLRRVPAILFLDSDSATLRRQQPSTSMAWLRCLRLLSIRIQELFTTRLPLINSFESWLTRFPSLHPGLQDATKLAKRRKQLFSRHSYPCPHKPTLCSARNISRFSGQRCSTWNVVCGKVRPYARQVSSSPQRCYPYPLHRNLALQSTSPRTILATSRRSPKSEWDAFSL
jgi:hypothetical protein